MIEAMACGAPVLAFRCGSTPEVIDDGVTGRMVDCEEEAIAALPEILSYDRRAVRQRFEERFTATRMVNNYVGIYRQLLRMRTSDGKMQSTWPRQLHVNGGNGHFLVGYDRRIASVPIDMGVAASRFHTTRRRWPLRGGPSKAWRTVLDTTSLTRRGNRHP